MSTTFIVRPLQSDGSPGVEMPTHQTAREQASTCAQVDGTVWVVVRKHRGTQIVDVYGPRDQLPAIRHLHEKHRPFVADEVDEAES